MSRRAHRRKRLAALASTSSPNMAPFVPVNGIDLPLEEPEAQPHNVNADLNVDGDVPNICLSSIIGIMRTSATPTKSSVSEKRLQQIARMKIRTRPKKGGIIPSGPQESQPYLLPITSSALGASYAAVLSKNLPPSEIIHSNGTSNPEHVEPLPSLFAYDLPRERDSGNVEYKWKLLDKSEDRVLHLTTQLAYRLSEGNGVMLYELGVCDDGYAQGISPYELECSIQVVSRMAHSLQCDVQILNRALGHEGVVAEVLVRRIGDTQQVDTSQTSAHDSVITSTATSTESSSLNSTNAPASASSGDLRLAFIGANNSGRSSLLGCLLSNQLDDGRGRSRLHVFRHRHEIEAGRTSAIARQILGFDAEGRITNYQIHHKKTLGTSSSSTVTTGTAPTPVTSNVEMKKKEKGLSSLFGGDDEEGSDSESDMDFNGTEDEDSSVDLGLPIVAAAPSTSSSTALPPASSLPPSSTTTNALNVSQACSTNDWQRILEHSHRVFTLFDLPSDFFATITGLIGTSCPDYCCIVVSCQSPATADATEPSASLVSALTREQILLCCALGIPFLLLLCKSDLTSSETERKRIVEELTQICLQAHVPTAGLQPHQQQPLAPTSKNLITVANKIPLLIPSKGTAGDEIHSLLERNMSASLCDSDLPPSHRTRIREQVLCARRMHADSHPLQVEEEVDSEEILLDNDDDEEEEQFSEGKEEESKSASELHERAFLYPPHTFTPILFLSSVTGEGIDEFKSYLFHLHNYRHLYWNAKLHDVLPSSPLIESHAQQSNGIHTLEPSSHVPGNVSLEAQSVEVSIDDIFTVDGVGSVVSGIILSGIVREGDTLLLGPLNNLDRASLPPSSEIVLAPSPLPLGLHSNSVHEICTQLFRPVLVKSLHISRKIFKNAKAGQSVTIALKRVDRALLRKGMVLLSMPSTASVPRPLSSTSFVNHWPRCCVGFEAFIQLFDPVSSRDNSPSKQHDGGDASRGTNSTSSRLFSPTSTSPSGSASSSKQRGLGLRFQPIVHVGNIRQSAEIVGVRFVQSARTRKLVEDWIRKNCRDEAATGTLQSKQPDLNQLIDEWELNPPSSSPFIGASNTAVPSSCALVRFEFLYQSEYLRLGRQILFREDKTRGTGIITKLHYVDPMFEQDETPTTTACSSSVSPIGEHGEVHHHAHHIRRPSSSGSTPGTATSSSLSPSPSPQRSLASVQKIRRKKSDPKSLLMTAGVTPTNLASFVFQLAKERRVNQELASSMIQPCEAGTSDSPGPPLLHSTTNGISKLPVSKSSNSLNQSLRPSSHMAASLPTTPALRPSAAPTSSHIPATAAASRVPHTQGGAQRARADSSGSITQLGSRPSHSTSDSALSSWLHAGGAEDLNSMDKLQLPAAQLPFLPSSLSTMPLSRIISVDSNGSYDTSSSPSLSSVPNGGSMIPPPRSLLLDDPSAMLDESESDEDNMDGIGDFFGQLEVPKKSKGPISAEELAKRKAMSKSKRHQKGQITQ